MQWEVCSVNVARLIPLSCRQVLDEADMLLCGSFQNQVIRLINMLRYDEKVLSWNQSSELENADTVCHTHADTISHTHADTISHTPAESSTLEEDVGLHNDSILDEDSDDSGDLDTSDMKDAGEAESTQRRDWRRVRRAYKRSKQYIFVAATLPSNGKKTAGGVLKRLFPQAILVSGNYLHYHNPRCVTFLLFAS